MDTYIRNPILADFFYPNEPLLLIHTIEKLLKEIPIDNIQPKALIVPLIQSAQKIGWWVIERMLSMRIEIRYLFLRLFLVKMHFLDLI